MLSNLRLIASGLRAPYVLKNLFVRTTFISVDSEQSTNRKQIVDLAVINALGIMYNN